MFCPSACVRVCLCLCVWELCKHSAGWGLWGWTHCARPQLQIELYLNSRLAVCSRSLSHICEYYSYFISIYSAICMCMWRSICLISKYSKITSINSRPERCSWRFYHYFFTYQLKKKRGWIQLFYLSDNNIAIQVSWPFLLLLIHNYLSLHSFCTPRIFCCCVTCRWCNRTTPLLSDWLFACHSFYQGK